MGYFQGFAVTFRKLFEKAIGNFFAAELPRDDGWRVFPGKQFNWPVATASSGIGFYLPIMVTDIIHLYFI